MTRGTFGRCVLTLSASHINLFQSDVAEGQLPSFVMAASDDFTRDLLNKLRLDGQLTGQDGTIDDATAELLLKTPPLRDLMPASEFPQGVAGRIATSGQALYSVSDIENVPIAEIVSRIEKDCGRFHPNLAASSQLASEQMHRSLLQLFEDVVRDKIVDLIMKKVQLNAPQSTSKIASTRNESSLMANFSGVGSGANAVVSRRPHDKGLERRDRALTAFVLPDQLREDLSSDIKLIVENELRRCVGTIGSDVDRIFRTIQEAKGRMSRIEEDILQRQVEGRMQAEQLVSQGEQIQSLTSEIGALEEHLAKKDSQMDILREQVLRRNQSLDESRVRFRREVLRYKQRLLELEKDLEAHTAKGRRRTSVAILNDINNLAVPADEETLMDEELSAAAESAVREATARLEELHRRREVELQREKKGIQTEMSLRLSERDAEIIRLKEKLSAHGQ